MNKGDIVRIYEDPLTEKKLDGKARLVKLLRAYDHDPLEMWEVKFLDEHSRYSRIRWVKKDTKRLCVVCETKELSDSQEWVCDECFNKELKKEQETQTEEDEETEQERIERQDESWRFKDSRGRSVFKREL